MCFCFFFQKMQHFCLAAFYQKKQQKVYCTLSTSENAHLHFQNNLSCSVCISVGAGADEHGQAGTGAPSAVIRCGLGGGEMGGAGT